MANTVFSDEPQTVELFRSMTVLMRWLTSLPPKARQRCVSALAECSDDIRQRVFEVVNVIEDRRASPSDRHRALDAIAEALCLKPDDEGEHLSQKDTFAAHLREVMTAKRVTQEELADRVGCSQPAISQMLNRKSRPQKKTILKLAEALHVQPQELWPDLEVAEMLDAAADFHQDDYVMTEAEARALRDATSRNVPKIPVRPIPKRER